MHVFSTHNPESGLDSYQMMFALVAYVLHGRS